MMKLKSLIKDKFDTERGLALEVAKEVGLKTATPLYKWLNENDREMDDLSMIVKMAKKICSDKWNLVIKEYFKELNPNKQSMRSALEYLSVFKDVETSKELLELTKNSDNKETFDFNFYYTLEHKALQMDSKEVATIIDNRKAKTIEMTVFSKFILMYAYLRDAKYQSMEEQVEFIAPLIEQMKEGYMKRSFTSRLNALKVSIILNDGDSEKTEKLGLQALETNERTPLDVLINMNMGNAYIMYDFNKAMKYFNTAIELAEYYNDETKKSMVQHSIDFCKCYWKVNCNPSKIDVVGLSSKYNKIFAHISCEEHEEAMQLIESIDMEDLDDDMKAFHFFYKGMITRDKDDFYESVEYFRKTGDRHYRNLSLIELKKLGDSERLLKSLSA